MKRYERYKDSGVEWLGEVPEHWKLIPNKIIFKHKKKIVGKNSNDYKLLSLTINGVIERDMVNPQGKFPAEFDTYQEVNHGDFIFCHFDVEETPRTVGVSSFEGMITGAYTVYSVSEHFNVHFLNHFYLNLDTDKRLKSLYKGLRNTIAKETFGAFKTFIPSIEEQEIIAKFLDERCAKIEKAIEQKEQMIELLNKRRQIIIQRAVTRGLNPDAPLRDSGIDWIGKIPSHWQVKRLKYLTSKIGSGITPSGGSTVYVDYGIPLLRSQNILFDQIDLTDVAYITAYIDSIMSNSRVCDGDVLLNITGGSIGRCNFIRDCFGRANVNQHVCILRPTAEIKTLMLYYLIRSNLGQHQVKIEQTGGNREGLTFRTLKEFRFAIPPIEEQLQITNYLDNVNEKTEKAISLKKQEIERLKEYKQVLINSAVTGKIKIE